MRCAAWRAESTALRVQVYALFNLVPFEWRNFGWLAMAHQLPTVLAVCIVCSFGTSMDIMAVQARSRCTLSLVRMHCGAHSLACLVPVR